MEKMCSSSTAAWLMGSFSGKLRLSLSFLLSRSGRAPGNESFFELDP